MEGQSGSLLGHPKKSLSTRGDSQGPEAGQFPYITARRNLILVWKDFHIVPYKRGPADKTMSYVRNEMSNLFIMQPVRGPKGPFTVPPPIFIETSNQDDKGETV